MGIISFGEFSDTLGYKTLDERVMRGSAGIMLFLGLIAFINGFVLNKFEIIPLISGFLLLNFIIGIFVNPKFSPTIIVATFIVRKQSKIPIGAIQKKFAWSLGLGLSVAIFVLSILLQSDITFFEPVCLMCIICLVLLFLESSFGICVGCQLYYIFINIGMLKAPEVKPNCMGDSCDVD